MSEQIHDKDCQWQKTTPEECEYRNTHYYCPHDGTHGMPDHRCTCKKPDIAVCEKCGVPQGVIAKEADFLVVRDNNTAVALIHSPALKKIPSLKGLSIIVAPDGIESLSLADLEHIVFMKKSERNKQNG
ncbi:MAG: hypothetical protein KGJ07_01585 [Patescibacteria group bacterium]|nr:hypothetical protein [Patescibacteria group bacterium]